MTIATLPDLTGSGTGGVRSAPSVLNPSFGLEQGKEIVKETVDSGFKKTGNWLLDKLGIQYKYDEEKDYLKGGVRKGAEKAGNAVANALGIPGKPFGSGKDSILDQIKQWFSDTQFFQRTALVVLALILLAAGLYLLGTSKYTNIAKGVE